MKAELHYWHKSYVREHYLLELKIWLIGKSSGYPEGYKYRLICLDQRSGKRVLIDNHSPKGHHIHLDENQLRYQFISEQELLADFKRLIFEHMGIKL